MNSRNQSHLRLAARILIEWKTPKNSPDYQRILRDVIALHPVAAGADLRNLADLFNVDDSGVLLWYLSESVNRPAASVSAAMWNDVTLDDTCEEELIRDMVTISGRASKRERIWEGGPTWTKLADTVLEAVTSENAVDVTWALIGYFAARCGISSPAIRSAVDALLVVSGRRRNILQRLARAVRRTLVFVRIAVYLLPVISTLFVIYVLVRGNPTGESVNAIVAALIILAISIYNFVRPASADVVAEAALNTTKFLFAVSGNRAWWRTKDRFHSQLGIAIATACGSTPGLFAQLLRDKELKNWKYLAFRHTSLVTHDVIREITRLLRVSELDQDDRDELFLWLSTSSVARTGAIALND